MLKITAIKILKIGNEPNPLYNITVNVDGYDKTKHRIILRVNTSFFTLNENQLSEDIYIFAKKGDVPFNGKELRIFAQLYDFQKDEPISTRRKDYAYSLQKGHYVVADEILNVLPEHFAAYWTKNKLVAKLEGPFDSQDKLITEITLGETYTYKATPNVPLNKTELLAIKWAYKYNDNKITNFKHQTETTNGNQNIMTCSFPKDANANQITVYAYYKAPSDKVSSKVGVFGKEVVEDGNGDIAENSLVWGNKISENEREKVIKVSTNLNINANWLMTVIALETAETFNPSIDNGIGYVGLIQFGESAAKDLGTTKTQLIKMSFIEQMDYVQKFLIKKKDKYKTLSDLYLEVLYPTASGHGNEKNYVVLKGKAYINNPLFFREEDEVIKNSKGTIIKRIPKVDGKTYVWEIEEVVNEIYEKGKKHASSNKIINEENNDNTNNNWYHPVLNPQLRGRYNIWAPERSIHSNNIIGRTKGKHDGIDLYAPQPTNIYACLDGEIQEIYFSTTYGNVINLKAEYNKKTLWFFYAHLSEVKTTAKDKNNKPTKVKAGELIGISGKTGSSAKNLKPNQVHLHFEVRTSASRTKNRVNPFEFIKELDSEVKKTPKQEEQL